MRTQCERCGECCLGGGPALHREDLALVRSGVLRRRHLVTFRKGEMARDQVRGEVVPLGAEIVKVKARGPGWTCVFYAEQGASCAIYRDRPGECRALKCWDTAELEGMYSKGRLTRADLVDAASGLWELIREHEEKCAVAGLAQLAGLFVEEGSRQAEDDLLALVRWDRGLRDALKARAGAGEDEMEFYFGRSLDVVLRQFGLRVVLRDGEQRLASGRENG